METFEEMEARHLRERADMVRQMVSRAYMGGKNDAPMSAIVKADRAFDEIVNKVCLKHSVTLEDLKSKWGLRALSEPRQELMFLLHRSGMGYSKIGERLNRDHTTIKSGVERHKKRNAKTTGE